MSRVDVIVPCYNYGRFLRECVESVLTQPVEVRVLIIDDASTDNTPEVAAALATEDARVEFRRHAVNRGHIATYNEGLEWISGNYTLLISADDLLVPGALLRACRLMDAHPELGFVYGRIIRWQTADPRPVQNTLAEEFAYRIIPGLEWIESVCKEGRPPTTSPEVLVRTELQQQLGGYRPELPHWADVDLLMRFATLAPVGYIDADQAYYRLHPTNMHLQYPGLKILEQHRITFTDIFDNHGCRLHRAAELKSMALRRVAEDAYSFASLAFERDEIETCKSYLAFALETSPEIRSWLWYSRLRWKLRMGPRAWKFVRPLWGRIKAHAFQH